MTFLLDNLLPAFSRTRLGFHPTDTGHLIVRCARVLRPAWVFTLYVLAASIAFLQEADCSESDVAFLGKHVAFPEINVSLSFEFGPSDYREGQLSAAQRLSTDAILRKKGAAETPQAMLELGDSWSRFGEDATARRWYLNALDAAAGRLSKSKEIPPLGDAITYGEALFRLGDTSKAIDVFAALSDVYPEAAEVQYHLSTVLLARGDLHAAEEVARQLITQRDDWLEALTLWGGLQFGLAMTRNQTGLVADGIDVAPIRAAVKLHPELDPALRLLEWNLRIAAHTLQRISERMGQSGPWKGISPTDPVAEELKTIRTNITPMTSDGTAPAAVWKAVSWLNFIEGRDEAFFASTLELLARSYDKNEFEFSIVALKMMGRGDLAVRLLTLKSVEYPNVKYRYMLAYLYDDAGEPAQAATALDKVLPEDPFVDMARAVLALRIGNGIAASASFAQGLTGGYSAGDADYYRGIKALLDGDASSAKLHLAAFRAKAAPTHNIDPILGRIEAEIELLRSRETSPNPSDS